MVGMVARSQKQVFAPARCVASKLGLPARVRSRVRVDWRDSPVSASSPLGAFLGIAVRETSVELLNDLEPAER